MLICIRILVHIEHMHQHCNIFMHTHFICRYLYIYINLYVESPS